MGTILNTNMRRSRRERGSSWRVSTSKMPFMAWLAGVSPGCTRAEMNTTGRVDGHKGRRHVQPFVPPPAAASDDTGRWLGSSACRCVQDGWRRGWASGPRPSLAASVGCCRLGAQGVPSRGRRQEVGVSGGSRVSWDSPSRPSQLVMVSSSTRRPWGDVASSSRAKYTSEGGGSEPAPATASGGPRASFPCWRSSVSRSKQQSA